MKILMIGDVVGTNGCTALREVLPKLKAEKGIDLTIVNGENAAQGNGILPCSVKDIVTSGADVITTGNHVFRRKEIYEVLDENEFLLRPMNYPDTAYGKGVCVVDMGRVRVGVINLMGVVYLESLNCPFESVSKAVETLKADGVKIIVLDFHAEATSEKRAMGFFLDGEVSVVAGTHTHVLTADNQVLPKGTGYITDLGMTGPLQSVLGVRPDLAIAKQKEKLPVRFENAEGESVVCGCIFEVDEKSGKTVNTERIMIKTDGGTLR